jgi:hypothetical protein
MGIEGRQQRRGVGRIGGTSAVLVASVGLALTAALAFTPTSAAADERHHDRRFEQHRRDWRPLPRQQFHRVFVHPAPWRFERAHGWRYEYRPGFWSPYYSWWWLNNQVVLRAAPTATVVQYPTGRYELRGDGVNVPYYWVWVAAYRGVVPAPPAPAAAPADVPMPAPPPPAPAG